LKRTGKRTKHNLLHRNTDGHALAKGAAGCGILRRVMPWPTGAYGNGENETERGEPSNGRYFQ
jgi:hypothetical protein